MSCDSNRAALFRAIGHTYQLQIGRQVEAHELLDLVYDTALHQPVPTEKIGQLAAAAATQKIMARAARREIDLYPHTSTDGLPSLASQHAWKQVSDLLDALDQLRPLPPLAADALQSLAFQKLADPAGSTLWLSTMSAATRAAHLAAWRDNPQALALALEYPPAEMGAEYDPLLTQLSALVAADQAEYRDVRLAAQQFQTLAEADALNDAERGAWARTLARAAGLGIGGYTVSLSQTCAQCGRWVEQRARDAHLCDEDDARVARRLVLALAPKLADPVMPVSDRPSSNPIEVADEVIEPMMGAYGWPTWVPESGSRDAALIDAARAMDRRIVTQQAQEKGFGRNVTLGMMIWLKNATRRAPVQFNGEPCVWDNGRLYRLTDFRLHANWALSGQLRAGYMEDYTLAVCEISAANMMRAMAGQKLPKSAFKNAAGAATPPTWPVQPSLMEPEAPRVV